MDRNLASLVEKDPPLYAEEVLQRLELAEKQLQAEIAFWRSLERSWWYRWLLIPGWPFRLLRKFAIAYWQLMFRQIRSIFTPPKSYLEVVQKASHKHSNLIWLSMADALVSYPRWLLNIFYRVFTLYILFLELLCSLFVYLTLVIWAIRLFDG